MIYFKYKFNLIIILLLSRVQPKPPITNFQKSLSNSKLLLDEFETILPKHVKRPCSKCFDFSHSKACDKCIKMIRHDMSERELSGSEVYFYETVKQNLREYLAFTRRFRFWSIERFFISYYHEELFYRTVPRIVY